MVSIDKGLNCYKLVKTMDTWDDALMDCIMNDIGELATITDGFEQSLVRLLTYGQSDPWIGLQVVSGSFRF